jgi:hypothetical protein
MKDEHIISLIENAPFASLSESDLTAIGNHTDHCSDCRHAFQAAQVSALLLKEHAVAAFEPPPFFHTRVMATLREREAVSSWSWSRLWRSAGALASSMVATVAALAVLTLAIPGTQVAGTQAGYANGYSVEEVIFDQTSQLEEESDGQLLTTIYGGEEDASR